MTDKEYLDQALMLEDSYSRLPRLLEHAFDLPADDWLHLLGVVGELRQHRTISRRNPRVGHLSLVANANLANDECKRKCRIRCAARCNDHL